ncbi:mucin-6 [Apis mellifera caucasica]|uniref:Mucin-6 n=1 Tax=Apis mellifera TaxID=7460 RepID=A0A7M7IJH7_APIME|nr:mucin-6 [Apis mellifera]KAG6795044.1 mucin-6 [Apis mellifera caucasica]KAG9428233.1 mucin-6 [Apis mellifera carnica]|eukprot:XP_016771997.1 mucin-6 [Apis mellifera]
MSRYVVWIFIVAIFVHIKEQSKVTGKDIKCERDEEVNVCGKLCEATCNNPYSNSELCPPIPCNWEITRDCRCRHGTVRNEKTKACIPFSKCPNVL